MAENRIPNVPNVVKVTESGKMDRMQAVYHERFAAPARLAQIVCPLYTSAMRLSIPLEPFSMINRLRYLIVPVILCSVLAAVAATAEKRTKSDENDYELYKALVNAMDQVERNYVVKVDRRELVESAIRGVLAKLDPYSAYVEPKEVRRFQAGLESEFAGIGIQVTIDNGQLTILSPLPGTPAYRAGLQAGDHIVEVEGKSTDNFTLDEAVERLQGAEGTSVTLTVVHAGQPGQAEGHSQTRKDPHRYRARRPPQARRRMGLHVRSQAPDRLRAAGGLWPR